MSSKKSINLGKLQIGGGAPVSIQTMWNRPIESVNDELVERIENLKSLGCDAIRFSAPNKQTVPILGELAQNISIPLIADIHYDHNIALECLNYPIAKLRLNPGNIGADSKIEAVCKQATEHAIPIRIGINGGSLPSHLQQEQQVSAMLKTAEEKIELMESLNFDNIIFSLKSSDPETVYEANKVFAQNYDYPIHLGVTEAGPIRQALVKSTWSLGRLLNEGIGDTIRISISGEPEEEVLSAVELLRTLGLRAAPNIISCPGCARANFDTAELIKLIEPKLTTIKKNISIAVMGCTVNGPGEAAHTDLAISGLGNKVSFYRHGNLLKTVPFENLTQALFAEIDKIS